MVKSISLISSFINSAPKHLVIRFIKFNKLLEYEKIDGIVDYMGLNFMISISTDLGIFIVFQKYLIFTSLL